MSLTDLPSRATDLLTVVGKLWPDVEPRLAGRGSPSDASRHQLLMVPDARRARQLLPASRPAASSTAVRRYSHDLGAARRLTRRVLAVTLRTGLQDRILPDRLEVAVAGDNILTHLSSIFGQDVVVSVGVGVARANRKPVLQVLTTEGRSLAFVKVGDTDVARDLVRVEAEALRVLAERRLPGIDVPRVLHLGGWRDLELLVLSPLTTGAWPYRSRGTVPVRAMRELARSGGTTRAALGSSAFFARLTEIPGTLRESAFSEPMAAIVRELGSRHGAEELEFGVWHGDWTPWNMAWGRRAIQLWDWERYGGEVPVGLDLLHYRSQVEQRRQGTANIVQLTIDAAGDLAESFGTHRSASQAVALAYLTELAARYCLAAEGSIGDPLRARTRELLDSLSRMDPR